MTKYKFARWEDATTNRIRHIDVESDMTLTPIYEKKGIMAIVDKIRGQLEVVRELLKRYLDVSASYL